ncbi:MAG: response regulator [Rhodospirillales bacterium]|nr:response regulator [Rhodospirillales bacterium]
MTNEKQILVVDDDDLFRQTLTKRMRLNEEFALTEATTGTDALDKAVSAKFDVIILDVGLPDMDGREICRLMRQKGVRAPIIMLTGADTDADAILGLDAGADDYVTKPFKIEVLLARIRSLIR